MQKISCESCHCRIRIANPVPGRKFTCPKCGSLVTVPEDPESVAAEALGIGISTMPKQPVASWKIPTHPPEVKLNACDLPIHTKRPWPRAAWLFVALPIACVTALYFAPVTGTQLPSVADPVPSPVQVSMSPKANQQECDVEQLFDDTVAALDAGQVVRAKVLAERYLTSGGGLTHVEEASDVLKEIGLLFDVDGTHKKVAALSEVDLESLGRSVGPDTLAGAAGAELRTIKNQRLKEQLYFSMRDMVANEMRRRDNDRELKKAEKLAVWHKEVLVQEAQNASLREHAAKRKALIEGIENDRIQRRYEASVAAERRFKQYILQMQSSDDYYLYTLGAIRVVNEIHRNYSSTGKATYNRSFYMELRDVPAIISIAGDYIPAHDANNGITLRQAWIAYLDQH